MNRHRARYRCSPGFVVVVAFVGLLLGACSSGPRMGHGPGALSGSGSGAMMNGAGAGAGMAGYHYSASTCAAAPRLTARTVEVVLADMGSTTMMSGTAPMGSHMMLRSTPGRLAAGPITFVAANRGWRTHEFVILPLSAGAAAGRRLTGADGRVAETGSLGEASSPCGADAGSGIPAGSSSWVTITLAPGRYELLCNLPNHYAAGMYQEFDVR